MNIVVSNVKGGVGKTTTSVYLAAAAVDRGWEPVALIDADRQASSAEWLEESPVEGVDLVEAPSERTVTRAMSGDAGLTVVDTPPGDERIVRAALDRADAVVDPYPGRRGGVLAGGGHPRDARHQDPLRGGDLRGALGTNDLDAAVQWWTENEVPIWGIIPERVGIASGPRSRLYREGLDAYDMVLRKALRKR